MILKIKDIKVGQRVRDEFGDMAALAESIREHGLLHPIVVDSDYNLIAGCRRLLACEQNGMKEIEVKVLGDISEKELRVLELEENIRRKDLTELEKSKNLVELAEIKEQELREKTEFLSDSDTNSAHLDNKEFFSESTKNNCAESAHLNDPNRIGVRTIAKEIGIPPKTLHDAKQHVKAVEDFPPLGNLPKYQALETAKELRKAPPEEQEKILDFASRKTQLPAVQKEENFYSYMDECWGLTKKYHKAINAFMWIKADEKEFKMISETIQADTAPGHLREVEDSIAKLTRLRKFLKGVISRGENKKAGT